MKIELAPSQTVCQEPPKPPPLPPNLLAATVNGDTVDAANASKTNTMNSNNNNAIATPQSQDTATRKQQQPLSSISIQDLNSVQVCTGHRVWLIGQKIFSPQSNSCARIFSKLTILNCHFSPEMRKNKTATTHRQSANENLLAAHAQREHAMLVVDQRGLPLAKN